MVWSTPGPGPWPLVSWWCLYTTQAGRQAGSHEGQVAGERSWLSQATDTTRACCDWLRPVRGTCLENHSPGGDESLHRASAHMQHMGKRKAPTDQIQRVIKCLPRFSNSSLGRCWGSGNSPQRFYCKTKMWACFPNSLGKRTN